MVEKYTGYCNKCIKDSRCCEQCVQTEFMSVPSEYIMALSKRWELYNNAIELWGIPAQEGMFIEEIGEVLTGINKKSRVKNGIDHREFVAELVDLEIMLEQMKKIHSDEISWKLIKERKISKLLKYIQMDA